MKRNNKKGFTIVELVIVIAVIGILAAVLIPTFSGVTEKAKESAALQEARNTWAQMLADDVDNTDKDFVIVSDGFVYTIIDGEIEKAAEGHESGVPTVDGYTLTLLTDDQATEKNEAYTSDNVTAVYTMEKAGTADDQTQQQG